jgi:predicted transposase/invertase (TIGR01784 family)
MKTDTLFYEIFQTQPGLLLALLGRDVAEIVNYDFRSVEVKQTAFRIDGLLIPKRAGTPAPVYFSEVQFQKDPQLYHRFFAEIFTYLKQYPNTPSWHGILIYPRRSLVPPRRYWELYRTLLESDQVTHIYLEDLQHTANLPLGLEIIQLVVEPKRRAKGFARQLVQRVQQSASSPIATDRLLDLIETILVYKFGSLTTKEIEAMFGLSELKKTRVYQEGREEGREEGVEAGREAGREEGREAGQVDERRSMIETTLKVRFAKIDLALAATIPALMTLPPLDRMQVLLNASREEIVDRFSPRA